MPEILEKIISEQLFLKRNYEAFASSPIHLGSNREFLAVLLKILKKWQKSNEEKYSESHKNSKNNKKKIKLILNRKQTEN